MDTVRETARELRAEAAAANERRLLVLHGDRALCYDGAEAAVDAFGSDRRVASISAHPVVGEYVETERTGTLLGTTYDCIVLDCHDTCRPNTVGRATGAVDGGGLLVVLLPRPSEWLRAGGRFEKSLAAPPWSISDVRTRFKRRFLETLRTHRGIAIVDVDAGRRTKHGRTDPPPCRPPGRGSFETAHVFPEAVYEACLSADQRAAVSDCERLYEPGTAVVLEADRGRGKSSAAGLAAAALAADGSTVVVTAPSYRNAAELFERAAELLETLGVLSEDGRDGRETPFLRAFDAEIRFESPAEAVESSADVLFVDEAAALPVRRLEELLSVAPATCLSTTVRGYEGAGRGFDVRFRDALEAARDVTERVLSEPIRYAAADPIEVWLFNALLLDATPPPGQLLEGTSSTEATYERLDRDDLADNEALLREVFGLLVSAHYRTQPDDLARLLDAPNVALRALTVDGYPVSVAMLAAEGGLDEGTRRLAYEGDRIRGNLIPDLLTSQLRDPEAGIPTGLRVVRIATHRDARSGGFGSRLLADVEAEYSSPDSGDDRFGDVDYLGVSYGVTPQLLSFWTANGYRTVHLSGTRNEASGERSAVMLRPVSEAGRELADRHVEWFRRRLPDVLSGALRSLDPDVVRGALASIDGGTPPELSDFEWRIVASAADGPGRYDTAPGPFRLLAFRALVDGAVSDPDHERLLVRKVLQETPWAAAADALGYDSERECKRALGDVYGPLVDRYGSELAREETDRFRDG